MNVLAHAVFTLVVEHQEPTTLPALSRFEQSALADLQHLFQHTPGELANLVDQKVEPLEWFSGTQFNPS